MDLHSCRHYLFTSWSCGRILYCKTLHDELFKNNPPINEQMLQMMMAQMGQKPSQKKINQMMSAMNKQQEKEKPKKTKK